MNLKKKNKKKKQKKDYLGGFLLRIFLDTIGKSEGMFFNREG